MSKKDFKNTVRSGLDNLIKPTTAPENVQASKDEKKPQKEVHCNFVMNKDLHIKLKIIATKKGQTVKDALEDALNDYIEKNREVLSNL